jgi:hypothetical protein
MLTFIENTTENLRVLLNGKLLEEIPGGDRKIFMDRDFVVKVDHKPGTKRSTRQTAREIELWEEMEEEDKKYFASLITYGRTPKGKYWLLQERYYPDSDYKTTTELKLEHLEQKYNIRDLWGYDCNWFQVCGDLVIYDWGIGPSC